VGWWADKLNGDNQAPLRPSPYAVPAGQATQAPPGYYPPQPFGAPNQQQGYLPPQPQVEQPFVPNTVDPTKVGEVIPIWHWTGNQSGGAGETATVGNCPSCGSTRYFSRRNGGGQMNKDGQIVPPAPECFECGYPKEQGNLGMPTQLTGATAPSRQGDTPPPGSLASLRR
jgi:hypothetical protein